MPDKKLNISTINPSSPFIDTLAEALLNQYKDKQEALADILILLPTRRTCRALQDSFLKLSQGKTLILPRMQPIGDIDAEELTLSLPDDMAFDIAPPIPSIKRQILLAKLIAAKQSNHAHGMDQDLRLAKALGHLLDEIHTENLYFSTLTELVEHAEIAEHWQITLSFLELLSIHWPKILKECGASDAAAYRNTLINTLNNLWQKHPPNHPVIMAGSTGSIPATGALAKTIASLPNGQVILPGLDKYMDNESWNAIEEGHPQATLKSLLNKIGVPRQNIDFFNALNTHQTPREKLISHIMLPASKTNQWGQEVSDINKRDIEDEIKKIHRYDCNTIQEEADIISLILRETLETPDKTAALITTNRQLARRVAQKCKKWGITLDDTAGKALTETQLGQYLHACAHMCISRLDSVALLSFLKHDFTSIKSIENFRQQTRNFEIKILRGKPIKNDFIGLEERYKQKLINPMERHRPSESTLKYIQELKNNIFPFFNIFQKSELPFNDYLKAHIQLAEKFYSGGKENLWSGDNGEAASKLFSELQDYNSIFGNITPHEYLEIITQFMSEITIRPKYGTHPRLQIMGQIEGRLVQSDRVILAGLNEGSWPPDPGHDPWMSRPMRQKFGLPAPERAITLAAHDFSQAFCANEVFLTRSIKMDGAPTVPARWLERMNTYLTAININPSKLTKTKFSSYVSYMDKSERTIEIPRPAPTPPIESRPKKLSVTAIDKWMKDPYSIYAQKILNLNKLSPLNEQTNAADRGTLFHEILHRFNKKYSKSLNSVTETDFIKIAQETLDENPQMTENLSFWRPRLLEFAEKYLEFEKKWRENNTLLYGEIQGHIDFSKNNDTDFILTARVDRIDQHHNGNFAIIDYKSGGQYSKTKIINGETSQLPLEGLILTEGKFEKIVANENEINYLGYWAINNSAQSIKEISIENANKINQSIADVKTGLISLIQTYQKPDTAYIAIPNLNNAPRFNDYEHLERVKEWAVLSENDNEEGY